MKKNTLLLLCCLAFSLTRAQRCLDMSTDAAVNGIRVPADIAASFGECHTRKIEHDVVEIVDYGDNVKDLDSLTVQDSRAFSMASAANLNTQMPSSGDIDAAKQLAQTMSSMTDEQKKELAMQMAQQQMQNAGHSSAIQDGAAIAQLVSQTQDIALRQLKALDDEFSAKLKAVNAAADKESGQVAEPDLRKCKAVIKEGLASCACTNKLYAAYWKQKVAIQEKYNKQKTEILNSYLPRIKALCSQVDANIKKLKYGDDIKSKQLKRALFSSQSTAFGNAALVAVSCAEDIRKSGADLYLNLQNSEHNRYDISCEQ